MRAPLSGGSYTGHPVIQRGDFCKVTMFVAKMSVLVDLLVSLV